MNFRWIIFFNLGYLKVVRLIRLSFFFKKSPPSEISTLFRPIFFFVHPQDSIFKRIKKERNQNKHQIEEYVNAYSFDIWQYCLKVVFFSYFFNKIGFCLLEQRIVDIRCTMSYGKFKEAGNIGRMDRNRFIKPKIILGWKTTIIAMLPIFIQGKNKVLSFVSPKIKNLKN